MAQPVSTYFNINKTTSSTAGSPQQTKPKINLFDFKTNQSVQPTSFSQFIQNKTSTPQNIINFWPWVSQKWVTNVNEYNPVTKRTENIFTPKPTTTQKSSWFSLIPTANADNWENTEELPTNNLVEKIKKWRWATNLFINERQALENMVNSWIDEEQALKAITEKRKELWWDASLSPKESQALILMAKSDIDINQAIKAVKEKRYDDATILQKVGKNILDLAAAWPALMAEQIANVWSFIFNDDELKQQAEKIRKIRKEDFESTVWGKAWSIITWAWEVLATWPTKLASTLGWRTAQWAVVWWLTWAATPVLEKWKDATMWDITTWWVVWWTIWAVATPLLEKVAIPVVAWVASKTMKYWKAWYYGWIEWVKKSAWRDIQRWIIKPFQKSAQDKAWNIALWWLINPAKLDAVKKWLMVDEWVATPQDVGKWMLDRIKPWNKQEIADQLIKHSEKSKKAVDEALAKIPDTFENETAKKALTQILSDLEWRVWFEDDAVRIAKLLNKDKYTLTELNWIKREMDRIYNIYKQSWEVSASLNAQWLNKVRQGIRKFIEEQGKKYWVDIRKLNNETSVARWLAEWIMKKDNADNVREFLSAFAPTWVWSVIWAWQSIAQGNDPLIVLRDTLIWWATAKILTSTKIRTLIADKINKLWPKEMSALEKYIKSWWADEVWRKVAEKIVPQKLLPPWRWPNKAIITPQTAEKGIIQESKLPLKNTKYGNNNINSSSNNNSSILLKPNKSKNETSNKPKNAIPNQTARISSKDWREVLETKIDKNFKAREEQLLEDEKNKFLNFLDRQKEEWSKKPIKIWDIINNNPKYQWLFKQAEEKKAKNEKAIMTIYGELEWSKAWERVFNWYWADKEVIWISSTFPKYIPEKSRTTPIVTRIIKHLNDWDVPNPKNVNVYEWYQAVIKRFESLWWDAKIFLKKVLPK